MKILVLRTDIKTKEMVEMVTPAFDSHPMVMSWSVDTMDIDNVLRIEATEEVEEEGIIELVKSEGFQCEALMD